MREATLRAPWLAEEEAIPGSGSSTQASVTPRLDGADGWTPERFAREQVRHLVRQVFFNKAPIQIRQVVFSAVDFQTDVQRICARVGEALAEESTSDVAVVGATERGAIRRGAAYKTSDQGEELELPDQSVGHGLRNLWFLPTREGRGWGTKESMKTYLNDIRREFSYSIVQAPPVTNCDEAISLAESSDGLILVLSAKRTRRVAAFRIREMLAFAQVRLLGTVLSDREFPIPEKIYRRL